MKNYFILKMNKKYHNVQKHSSKFNYKRNSKNINNIKLNKFNRYNKKKILCPLKKLSLILPYKAILSELFGRTYINMNIFQLNLKLLKIVIKKNTLKKILKITKKIERLQNVVKDFILIGCNAKAIFKLPDLLCQRQTGNKASKIIIKDNKKVYKYKIYYDDEKFSFLKKKFKFVSNLDIHDYLFYTINNIVNNLKKIF